MRKIDFSKFDRWNTDQINGTEPSRLERCLVDLSKDYAEVEYLLKRGSIGCVPRGEQQMIVGPQKSGKTFASMIFETALLSGQCMGFEAQQENLTILHIDTGQHGNSVADKNKKLLSLAGYPSEENYERLHVLTIKELSASERLSIVQETVEKFKPDFVLIDGIRDLCDDFNNVAESNNVINVIMKLTSMYNCAIMSIIHQNKGKDDNPRGHLGTELMNKCTDGYFVTRGIGAPVSVSQKICRNAPIGDWFFIINDEGKPETAYAPITQKDSKLAEIADNFRQIYLSHEKLSHSELVREYSKISGYTDSTAKKHIKQGLQDGVLQKEGKHYFYLFPPYEEDTES